MILLLLSPAFPTKKVAGLVSQQERNVAWCYCVFLVLEQKGVNNVENLAAHRSKNLSIFLYGPAVPVYNDILGIPGLDVKSPYPRAYDIERAEALGSEPLCPCGLPIFINVIVPPLARYRSGEHDQVRERAHVADESVAQFGAKMLGDLERHREVKKARQRPRLIEIHNRDQIFVDEQVTARDPRSFYSLDIRYPVFDASA